MSEQIRVRFAPSPTGPFHIGGARSALFNWLLARKYPNGKLILRVEDTDQARSTKESEENIKESLKWLGLTWDEGVDAGGDYGPYRQMERLDIYKKYAQKLIDEGKAYYCYCTEEEIVKEREALMKENKMPIYQGHCRNLTQEQIAQYEAEGRKPTIRFRTPENQAVEFEDLVRGHMNFDSNGVGDFVIVKADGIPVYNFAVVIDDALMKISHVIRAEEHLSNTPRQVVLYEALDFAVPKFAHISLILGKDHSKMSKRHGATSVEQYKNLGYLPEALVNFLALLGWAPQDEQEIFTIDELIKAFSMDHVAKNPAVFDIDKLNWLNAQYMKKLSAEKITMMAIPHLVEKGYLKEAVSTDEMAKLVRFTEIIRDHLSYGAQYLEFADLYFKDDIVVEDDEAKQVLLDETANDVMALFQQKLAALEEFDAAHIQPIFKQVIKELKVGGKKVYMPLRVAITGQMHGPDLAGIIEVLGYDKMLSRMQNTMSAF
ncbi:glutamate--tRNA ligase [Pectinatus brassicae]|uniref:Glutamate--tRNA ligase n=1 Tax=Pectinatus brassicae TaxID=862415 RepID=A0A840UMI3_9FIRM|nr:glutamate--tRNA ligase [Pectinatus brassicae]MBB5335462.1 nondiscriminating glutamyl-tRNA synthetase [Pectinatus brassicae]